MKYKTGLWKKVSEQGNHYCSGKIQIGATSYKVVLFKNEKKNDKSPDFNLILEDRENVQMVEKSLEVTPENKSSIPSDDEFAAFGEQIEIDPDDFPF